jgi:acetoin utilization protein AcuB
VTSIYAFCPGIIYESVKFKGVTMTGLENIMSKALVTIGVDGTLTEAFQLMREHRIRHLPVVDDRDGIVGIFSSKDFPSFVKIKDMSVEFFMSSPVIYVNKEASLKEAINVLLENKVSSLIVADETNKALGIVTTDDLLWYLVKHLDEEHEQRSVARSLLDADTLEKVAYQISMAGI